MIPRTGQVFWLSNDTAPQIYGSLEADMKTLDGVYTFSSKRRQEAILPGGKRGLDIGRSALGPIVIVIVSKSGFSV